MTIASSSRQGLVYFVEMGDVLKIGHTVNLGERMSNLQGGCAAVVNLLATIPGSKRLERELHKTFKADRIRGEFFKPESYFAAAPPCLRSTRIDQAMAAR